ncbi:Reverse transcriptase (RNA-dependent DNA polymerase) [Popillia japonica]|uniref:Reverse transcriptase (RNA-dependent DNA polymerase) n=1 Tax=Popillia japonica TaxID=7064 RepID=A0AAW1MYP8_POPJA
MYENSDLSKLRTFEGKAWAVNLPKEGKFDERAKEVYMVGYSPNGYRLWDPDNNVIILSRDTRFDEKDFVYKEKGRTMEKYSIQEDEEKEHKEENHAEERQTMENIQEDEEKEHKEENHAEERQKEELGTNNEESISQTRLGRKTRPPKYLKDYEIGDSDDEYQVANIAYCLHIDSQTYEEAMDNSKEWKHAIQKELRSHEELGTWKEVTLPESKRAIDTKWVFITKQNGEKKARLVAKGFQADSKKYTVYSPVARM